MFGNYRINQGVYKFSLQEVIRKDFIIKDGSTITFNGAPLDANMDIQASYTVNSASLNDLIPDASAIIQQPNVACKLYHEFKWYAGTSDYQAGHRTSE